MAAMMEYELEALPELEGTQEVHEFAGAHEFEDEAALEWEGAHEWESVHEGAMEGAMEWELEANPLRRVYPDALMEHLGHAAAEASTEAEAEAFLGALVPLAAQIVPRVAPAIMRAAPRLLRGVTQIGRTLRRNPATRPLMRAVPGILRRTVATVARQRAAGQPVTPQTAVRALVRQTQQVLRNPQTCRQAVRRARILDRRYHQAPAIASTPVAVVGGQPCQTCTCCGGAVSRAVPGISTRL